MDEKKQEKLPTLDEYLEWYYGVKPVHKEITPEYREAMFKKMDEVRAELKQRQQNGQKTELPKQGEEPEQKEPKK